MILRTYTLEYVTNYHIVDGGRIRCLWRNASSNLFNHNYRMMYLLIPPDRPTASRFPVKMTFIGSSTYIRTCYNHDNMAEDVTGLMSLVAFGGQDAGFNTNPQYSIYDKIVKKVHRSTFTYCTQSCTSDGIFKLNDGIKNEYGIDLIGDCYLHFKDSCVLEYCVFEYKTPKDKEWFVLERLDADIIDMFSSMKPREYAVRRDGKSTMIPLPFFFTHTSRDYFPLTSNVIYRIRYVGKGTPELIYKGVHLDTAERHAKITHITQPYDKPYIFSTVTKSLVQGPSLRNIRLDFKYCVKDIQVLVKRVNDQVRVIVPEIRLSLNRHLHYKLNSMMTTDIIPSKSYHIENNKQIHYLPFCQDPTSGEYTSSVNLSRIDYACLELHGLDENNKYEVIVMARYYNTVKFISGMCMMCYK